VYADWILEIGYHVMISLNYGKFRQAWILSIEGMNLSGTINTFRLVYAPKLARPHVILSQFNELTFPLSRCIVNNVKRQYGVDVPEPDIRAVVIDKDNCISKPHSLEVWPAYKVIHPEIDLILG